MKWLRPTASLCLVPLFCAQVFGDWSTPLKIYERDGYSGTPLLAAGAAGSVFTLWYEQPPAGEMHDGFMTRAIASGPWGWGPSTCVTTDGSAQIQPPPAVAMHTDGTVVLAWRQVLQSPFESQIVVRKFVPGSGWGAVQKLSSLVLQLYF